MDLDPVGEKVTDPDGGNYVYTAIHILVPTFGSDTNDHLKGRSSPPCIALSTLKYVRHIRTETLLNSAGRQRIFLDYKGPQRAKLEKDNTIQRGVLPTYYFRVNIYITMRIWLHGEGIEPCYVGIKIIQKIRYHF